ncbi:MAG: amidohydrolase family protein [Limnochordales bacterium]
MKIDYHTHIGREQEHYANAKDFLREARLMRQDATVTMDVDPEAHRQAMQDVEKAIVLAFRSTHLGFNVDNDYVAAYVRTDPDKFIGFLSVDPHEANCMEELERAYFDLGLRGIKMSPIYQAFHPMDERILPVYKFAEQHGLPILIHQGATFPRRAPLKYAHPAMLEDVALAFPELRVIIAHLGHPWEHETIVLIRKQPHFYADLSGLFYRPWQLYNSLLLCQEYGVMHKLLPGSDYPVSTPAEADAGLRRINDFLEGTKLPRIREEAIEEILARDYLAELNLA